MKRERLAILVPGLVALALAAACSSSSSGAPAGPTVKCPAVGSKPCPNDPAYSQQVVSACNTCLSQYQALVDCDSNAAVTSCDASGVSNPYTAPPACTSLSGALTSCLEDQLAENMDASADGASPVESGAVEGAAVDAGAD
jgi:hypothetical protein